MFKLHADLIGLGPFIGVMVYLWGRTIWAASRIGGYPLATAIGLTTIIFTMIVFVLLVARTHPFTRWFLCVFGIALCGIGIVFALVGEFRGMYVLILICWYEGVYGVAVGHDIIRHLPRRRMNLFESFKLLFPKPARRELLGLTICVVIGVSGIAVTQAWQFDSRTDLKFSISAQEMQMKELGLYWVRDTMADPQGLVEMLRDTNTTLLLQGNPDLFREINDYTVRGAAAADIVRRCNLAGVKVEIWPVPSANFSCALSLRFVDCMPVVYEFFKEWLARNAIAVDYYAFDIEDYIPLPSFDETPIGKITPSTSPMYGTLRGMHDMAAKQAFLRNNRSTWIALVAQQQSLIDQIRADGMIPRATTQPIAWDALDGDLTEFQKDFMQSYEIQGYEYLSGMYYRSCEWGNYDSTYKVYQNVRILDAVSPYPKTAVCIGCIGYPAYVTQEEVANDVWLSVGAGADSVRLFIGDSWVYREATEADGIASLRAMLELCRTGGTAVTEYSAAWDTQILGPILADVLGDL